MYDTFNHACKLQWPTLQYLLKKMNKKYQMTNDPHNNTVASLPNVPEGKTIKYRMTAIKPTNHKTNWLIMPTIGVLEIKDMALLVKRNKTKYIHIRRDYSHIPNRTICGDRIPWNSTESKPTEKLDTLSSTQMVFFKFWNTIMLSILFFQV